jgi:hypothetical protein
MFQSADIAQLLVVHSTQSDQMLVPGNGDSYK